MLKRVPMNLPVSVPILVCLPFLLRLPCLLLVLGPLAPFPVLVTLPPARATMAAATILAIIIRAALS